MSLLRRLSYLSFLFAFMHAQIASGSISVSWPKIGGTTYSVPQAGETGWANLTNYLVALQNAQGTTSQTIGVRTATTSPVTVSSANDTVVIVKRAVPGATTVNLPAGFTGQYFAVVDGTGDASTNNITVDPNGAQTINGALTYVIAKDRKAVLFVFSGTEWAVFAEYGSSSFTASNGILVQTATDVYAARTIQAGSSKITVANGNGIAGDPSIDVGSITAGTGLVAQTGASTYAGRTLTAGSSKVTIANGSGVSANPTVDVSEADLTLNNIGGTLGITKGGTGQVTKTPAYNALSPITTKGDLITSDGTNNVRLGVGADTFVLTADAAQSTGVKWATVPSGFANPMTTAGDLIIGGASGAPARLAAGTAGQLLQTNGATAPSWVSVFTPPSGASAVGTPTYSWDGSSNNTGLYLSGTDAVGLSSNGVQSLGVSSAGAFAIGPVATGNQNGQRHVLNGGLWAGNVTSTSDSGAFGIGSNARIAGSTALDSRTNATTGGSAIFMSNSTSASAGEAFTVYSNQPGDTTSTAATAKFAVTLNGSINASQIHNIGSGNITSGRYTPTLTANSNVGSLVSSSCLYSRVGNIVTVSGAITAVSGVTIGGVVRFYISLPIASNLTASSDLAGTAVWGSSPSNTTPYSPAYVLTDAVGDRAEVFFQNTQISTNANVTFTFQYEVK